MVAKSIWCIFCTINLIYFLSSFVSMEEIKENDDDGSDKRIIAGQEATPGQYPFMASLRYRYFDESNNRPYSRTKFCGGSIIAERWILTAAHCIQNSTPERVGDKQISVTVGLTDQAQTDHGQEIAIKKIIPHANFKSGTNDIGLLYLEEPIIYSERVQPIKLPPEDYKVTGDVHIMGWGQTHPKDAFHGNTSKLMTLPNIRVVPNDECEEIYGYPVEPNHICVGGSGVGSCFGDSGGPMAQFVNGQIVQPGVASVTHIHCGLKPSKYENVMRHIKSFIIPTIRQEQPDFDIQKLF